jgi:rubrerythrin
MHVSGLLARATSPFVFALPRSSARKLAEFAEAEHGSMIELRQAAAREKTPRVRALFLRHALDESRHARMFARASAELRARAGKPPLPAPRGGDVGLHERLGPVGFLAFVHRAERKGRAQFEAYRDFFLRRGEARLAAMFEAILTDERRHEAYSRELLVERAGGEAAARRALRRAAAFDAWNAWRRAGRALGQRVYVVLMLVLFAAILPLALLVRAFARAPRGSWRTHR